MERNGLDPYLAFEKLPVGIFVLRCENKENKEFRNIYVNQTNCDIVGVDLKPFMGQTLRESFPDSYKHGLPDMYMKALETGEKIQIGDVEYGDQTVKQQTFLLEVIPIDSDTVMLTTENISNLRRTQIELEEKNRILEQKNKEVEEFVYIASHDLKEPINTMASFVQLFRNEYEKSLDDTAKQYCDFVQASTTRMHAMINDLLDYSRIGQKSKKELVDCNLLLKEIQDDLSDVIHRTNTKIEIEGVLPELVISKTEFRLLFQNLISNAIKFSKSQKTPHIKIGVMGDEQKEFYVSDNGIGIDEKNKGNIFKMFKRLHPKGEYEGTGIGLAHCLKIINNNGGRIRVESKLGEGSKFIFNVKNEIKCVE